MQKVYAAMVYLHDSYDMHAIFKPGFPGMLECFYAQEELVKLLMPDVAEVFVSSAAMLDAIAFQPLLTQHHPMYIRRRTISLLPRSLQSGTSLYSSMFYRSVPSFGSGICSYTAARMS